MIVAFAAAVIGSTTLWVLWPLLGWGGETEEIPSAAADAHEELLATRRELLAAIKDLEMEFEIGRLSREDYEETRERLTREAVEVLRKLDSGVAGGTAGAGGPDGA